MNRAKIAHVKTKAVAGRGEELKLDGSNSYERGCRGKIVYETRAEAKAKAKERTQAVGVKHYVYRCLHVPHWHLSTQPPRS